MSKLTFKQSQSLKSRFYALDGLDGCRALVRPKVDMIGNALTSFLLPTQLLQIMFTLSLATKETNVAHAPQHPENFLEIHSKRGKMRNGGCGAGIVNIHRLFPKGRHAMNGKMMSHLKDLGSAFLYDRYWLNTTGNTAKDRKRNEDGESKVWRS